MADSLENRNAENFGHGFFEHLQTFTDKLKGQLGNARDVSARTRKAVNESCFNRIAAKARENDRYRLGGNRGRTGSCGFDLKPR